MKKKVNEGFMGDLKAKAQDKFNQIASKGYKEGKPSSIIDCLEGNGYKLWKIISKTPDELVISVVRDGNLPIARTMQEPGGMGVEALVEDLNVYFEDTHNNGMRAELADDVQADHGVVIRINRTGQNPMNESVQQIASLVAETAKRVINEMQENKMLHNIDDRGELDKILRGNDHLEDEPESENEKKKSKKDKKYIPPTKEVAEARKIAKYLVNEINEYKHEGDAKFWDRMAQLARRESMPTGSSVEGNPEDRQDIQYGFQKKYEDRTKDSLKSTLGTDNKIIFGETSINNIAYCSTKNNKRVMIMPREGKWTAYVSGIEMHLIDGVKYYPADEATAEALAKWVSEYHPNEKQLKDFQNPERWTENWNRGQMYEARKIARYLVNELMEQDGWPWDEEVEIVWSGGQFGFLKDAVKDFLDNGHTWVPVYLRDNFEDMLKGDVKSPRVGWGVKDITYKCCGNKPEHPLQIQVAYDMNNHEPHSWCYMDDYFAIRPLYERPSRH